MKCMGTPTKLMLANKEIKKEKFQQTIPQVKTKFQFKIYSKNAEKLELLNKK